MPLVAPAYLSERSLPYASDVLYHYRITYLLPTGFHPLEIHSVADFPAYCQRQAVALPMWVWDFCDGYFKNTRAASECLDILEPLRQKHLLIAQATYAPDRDAI